MTFAELQEMVDDFAQVFDLESEQLIESDMEGVDDRWLDTFDR